MKNNFKNDDRMLLKEADRIIQQRKEAGLEGLVGGLEAVIINTQSDLLGLGVQEFLNRTGLNFSEAFYDADFTTYLLQAPGCPDFLLRSRTPGHPNPFAGVNDYKIERRLPDTRLETFIFSCTDLKKYHSIQKKRGIAFRTSQIQEFPGYFFLESNPSALTGNSTGFVQWKSSEEKSWRSTLALTLDRGPEKPDFPFLRLIGRLDHCATRVRARDRDAAILEFMNLTNYRFVFSVYVESLNSITNVSRREPTDFALVFTSGISSFVDDETSGPTEKFIHTHGPRVHHMAFDCREIERVVEGLREHGQRYLEELIGSREEGLKQIFTVPSRSTFLVNEYIQRYDGFDGFFTKSNVTHLTRATMLQD